MNMNKNKTGRKATAVNEITDRNFTIVDLININSSVKAPTIRMHVKRSVASGRYKISGSQKTGKRGKPSIVYTYESIATATVSATETAVASSN
jgi:hypothetical protein